MTSDAILDEVGEKFLQLVADRIATLGEDGSGAYAYYALRLKANCQFLDYERELFDLLRSEKRVFHVGVGLGPLTVALSKAGVQCVGFEGEARRWEGAKAISEAIAPYEIRRGRYPALLNEADRTDDAILLFTNVGAGWTDELEEAIIGTFHRFRRVILDLQLFGRSRKEPAERDALKGRIATLGFRIEDCPVGRFYVSVNNLKIPTPQ